jgi:protein Mpv17
VVQVASKVAIDQVLWAPVFTAVFFGYLGLTEGKSQKQIVDKIKNDTWTGVTTSWKFWPLAHTINFALVPTQHRLLYVNTLQVGYNMILSLLGNK